MHIKKIFTDVLSNLKHEHTARSENDDASHTDHLAWSHGEAGVNKEKMLEKTRSTSAELSVLILFNSSMLANVSLKC